MEKTMIKLPGTRREHTIHIPTAYLGEILSPQRVKVRNALPHLLEQAMEHPIGAPPLKEIVQPSQKILIVVDDITRSTPIRQIAPLLLAHLLQSGCATTDITFALALGTHRPMTEAEIVDRLGAEIVANYTVLNTPAQVKEAFTETGESWGGVPIEVNRAVLEADIVIGVGSVVPHADAGWSGGCKIILPGMCSERTVMENHILSASFSENMLGKISTVIRENMEAIVEKIGLDFILNVVMTPYGEVIDIKGGNFIQAQRAAVQVALPIYSIPFRERADIVVSNVYPYEIDLWQGSKGIWAGEMMVKEGGVVILIAPCYEGIGPHPDYIALIDQTPEQIMENIQMGLIKDKNVAGSAIQISRMLAKFQLAIVSETLVNNGVKSAQVSFFRDLQSCIDHYLASAAAGCRVSVLTHSGYSYPVQTIAS
jgi:nickel-dependent lactate racemase